MKINIKPKYLSLYNNVIKKEESTFDIKLENNKLISSTYQSFVNKDVVASYKPYTQLNYIKSNDDMYYVYKDMYTFIYSKKPIQQYTQDGIGYDILFNNNFKTNSKVVYRSYELPYGGINKRGLTVYQSSGILKLILNPIYYEVDYISGCIYIRDDIAINRKIGSIGVIFNTVPLSIKGLGDLDVSSNKSEFYDIINTMYDKIILVSTTKGTKVTFNQDCIITSSDPITADGSSLHNHIYVTKGETILIENDKESVDPFGFKTIPLDYSYNTESITNKAKTVPTTTIGYSFNMYSKVLNNTYDTNPTIINL